MGSFYPQNQKHLSVWYIVKWCLSLCLFFEDLSRQTNSQIRKGIRTKLRVIKRHKYKIENPHTVYPEWDSFSDERKQREIKHWMREIATHEREIAEREKILEQRTKEEKS